MLTDLFQYPVLYYWQLDFKTYLYENLTKYSQICEYFLGLTFKNMSKMYMSLCVFA